MTHSLQPHEVEHLYSFCCHYVAICEDYPEDDGWINVSPVMCPFADYLVDQGMLDKDNTLYRPTKKAMETVIVVN